VLAGLTLPLVFGLIVLVYPLQSLLGGPLARLILFGLAFAVARFFAKWRDTTVGDLGWVRPTASKIGSGYLIGIGLVSLVAGIMVAAGWYELAWSGSWGSLLAAILSGLAVGLFEEALFRSLWFGGLEPALGTWLALMITAVFFGLLHWLNPGATLISSVAIALTAGLLLGAVFVVWRDVWLVAAVHAAWNATLGGFYGMAVSGQSTGQALLSARESGPDLWTGGAFGPEASLVSILVVGGVTVFLLPAVARSASAPVWRRTPSR